MTKEEAIRALNIITRAVKEFGMEIDVHASMEDVSDKAEDVLYESDIDDIVEIGPYTDSGWYTDGKGFKYNTNGFPNDETYYRYTDDGHFEKIKKLYATSDDYEGVIDVINTDAEHILLVRQIS